MSYLYLSIAIVSEVIGTSALKAANGFSRLGPTLLTTAGYAIAFYCMSLSLRTIPIGIAYAIWSGVGIILVSITGFFLYGQRLDFPALLGIFLILLGVLTIYGFSEVSAR
jgi:small multidrug resistance pump